jgi:hypothetical protein
MQEMLLVGLLEDVQQDVQQDVQLSVLPEQVTCDANRRNSTRSLQSAVKPAAVTYGSNAAAVGPVSMRGAEKRPW